MTSDHERRGPAVTSAWLRTGARVPPGPVAIRRRPRHGRGRLSARGAIAAALLSAGLLAGCGGAHTSSSSTVMSGALAYANCMRSHGVPDFPDPNSQGEFQLHTIFENGRPTQGEDLTATAPAFQTAERTCGPFGSAGHQVTEPQERQAFQEALKAAACMRANGVPDYPDPKLLPAEKLIRHETAAE
jgi:hypothetical protein